MKVLLVYPPFCTPTVPPHSITYLASYLSSNSELDVKCLDLNAKFHRKKFGDLYHRLEKAKTNPVSYSELLEAYVSMGKKVHRDSILRMSEGGEPELFDELFGLILQEKPDAVGFSLVYNSQVGYSLRLAEELSKKGIDCVAGGPATDGLAGEPVKVLKDGADLLKYLTKKEKCGDSYALDFSAYPEGDYLSKEMIHPVRSSHGCCYKGCAFCTHHGNLPYKEIDVEEIKKVILNNKIKNLFFIDDNIPAKRLSELAEMLGPLGVRWWCQTRPTENLLGLFGKLRESGLVSISFGVESGDQRILDLMGKGTKVADVERVLSGSHEAGVKNIVFIMFGFPGENKASFIATIDFLKDNCENIDIVSASVFGLQKGSRVYSNPSEFGVFGIHEYETALGESVGYEVTNGLSEKQAKIMKESFARELRGMNRLPNAVCLLKEQSLLF